MPFLDFVSTLGTLDKVLENPAWLMFGLTVALGGLGLMALLLLYPFGKE